MIDREKLARMIDHTILKAEATEAEVRKIVQEAIDHRFASVCVNGRWVNLVSDLLQEGGDYRLAVSARTSQTSGASTRAVRFHSQEIQYMLLQCLY